MNTRGDISALANLSKLNNIAFKTSSTNGNMAKLPANLYFIGLNNYKGTGFTWDTRPSSANIFGVEGSPLVLNVDAMLNDLANCQKPTIKNDKVWYRKILISGNRTSASDAAVQTLQSKGYTVSITPA